jgi:cobalt transporter subunit CbtA
MSAKQIQKLMRAAFLAGAISGSLLFVYQHLFVVPLIMAAEEFEAHGEAAASEGKPHDHSEWQPREGLERSALTAAGTILTGIGFAAILLALVVLGGFGLDVGSGLLWGIAGFACFTVAPALGLPPVPPGVPMADVGARQLWWVLTVGLTGLGSWLIIRGPLGWSLRVAGAVLVLVPHAIGAPHATGPQVVPASLIREFAIVSIIGNGSFWLLLGTITGWLFPIRPATDS